MPFRTSDTSGGGGGITTWHPINKWGEPILILDKHVVYIGWRTMPPWRRRSFFGCGLVHKSEIGRYRRYFAMLCHSILAWIKKIYFFALLCFFHFFSLTDLPWFSFRSPSLHTHSQKQALQIRLITQWWQVGASLYGEWSKLDRLLYVRTALLGLSRNFKKQVEIHFKKAMRFMNSIHDSAP